LHLVVSHSIAPRADRDRRATELFRAAAGAVLLRMTLLASFTVVVLSSTLRRPNAGCSANTLLLADNSADTGTSWWQKKMDDMKARAPGAVGAVSDPDMLKALALMKKRSLRDCEQAVVLFRKSLLRSGVESADPMLKLELANALNTVCRIRTNANSLVIDGVQDSPAFKKIWRTLGGEALPLATDARNAMPGSVRALAVYADAFLYSSSSKGIVKQALTGVGKKYLAIANELYKYPEWDSAVGCAFLGGFYNVAPWPVGNKGKAAKFLREGARLAPTRRNLYYAGVNAYQMGEFGDAADFFSRTLKAGPCKSPSSTEADFADFILAEAKRGLKLSEEALAGGGA
jgi:hypothetical protein